MHLSGTYESRREHWGCCRELRLAQFTHTSLSRPSWEPGRPPDSTSTLASAFRFLWAPGEITDLWASGEWEGGTWSFASAGSERPCFLGMYVQSVAGLTRVEKALLVPAGPLLTASYSRTDNTACRDAWPEVHQSFLLSTLIVSLWRPRAGFALSPLSPVGRSRTRNSWFPREFLLLPKTTVSSSSQVEFGFWMSQAERKKGNRLPLLGFSNAKALFIFSFKFKLPKRLWGPAKTKCYYLAPISC